MIYEPRVGMYVGICVCLCQKLGSCNRKQSLESFGHLYITNNLLIYYERDFVLNRHNTRLYCTDTDSNMSK